MSITEQKDEAGNVVICLADSVDIAHAGELKAALVRSLVAPVHVLVDVAQVTALDVTGAQLLWAAQRQALASEAVLEFRGPWNDEAVAALRAVGFPDLWQADQAACAVGDCDADAS